MKTKSLVVVFLSFVFLFSAAAAENWSFVILGDTRGGNSGEPGADAVSSWLPTLATKIKDLNPSMVIVPGDLTSGNYLSSATTYNDFMKGFEAWTNAMSPVMEANIPIFPVRGNHDNTFHDYDLPNAELVRAYTNFFNQTRFPNLPRNGPTSPTNEVGLTYSFTTNNLSLFAVDQYFQYGTPSGQDSIYHTINQSWLQQQLETSTSAYKIVMAHEPVFWITGTAPASQRFFGTNDAAFETRSNFWNTLGANGVQLYVAGHVHNVSVSMPGGYSNSIFQLVSGNGGALALSSTNLNTEAGVNVEYVNDDFGFALANVSNTAMTISYYRYHTNNSTWSVASYRTEVFPVPEPSTSALVGSGMMLLAARILGARVRRVRRS